MKKKKWIYITLFVVLLVPLLLLYQAFNGNPASKYFSKRALAHYLADTYPKEQFRISDGFYNFKIGGYAYDVVQIGSGDAYEFEVQGFIKPKVTFDGVYYANLDESLMEKLGNEAANEITALLKKEVPEIVYVDVQIEILKGKLAPDTKWNKTLPLEKPMYIHITTNAAGKTKKDVASAMKKIQEALNANGYEYGSATMNANIMDNEKMTGKDDFGYVKFSGSFKSNETIRENDIEQLNE
jgi:hypothetical protein